MKQLTVLIENRLGRLDDITNILSSNNINIICLSLSDTSEYGMLRMIVSQPALAQEKLSLAGFSSMLSDVTAIKIPNHFGSLNRVTALMSENGLDIKYMYALNSGSDAALVVKTNDNEKLEELLSKNSIAILPAVEVYNL